MRISDWSSDVCSSDLPGVKSWVKGVANVRGRLLPVMDLCGYFGLELSALRKQRRVLVVDHQEVFAGLTVDEAFGMKHLAVVTFTGELPPIEASIQPFINVLFLREQTCLVFSTHALATKQAFLTVAL